MVGKALKLTNALTRNMRNKWRPLRWRISGGGENCKVFCVQVGHDGKDITPIVNGVLDVLFSRTYKRER